MANSTINRLAPVLAAENVHSLGHDASRVSAWTRALVVVIVGWVPLLVLASWEGSAIGATPRESLLFDLAAYGRYLVAAPLFVLATPIYLGQLTDVVHHFVNDELIGETDRGRFDSIVKSTRRLLESRAIAVVLIVLAYVTTLALSRVLYPADTHTWVARVDSGVRVVSLAGWWRALVTQPLFLVLFAFSLWRLALWARFLWVVARMDLRLVASHPDHLGGLRFLSIPLQGLSVLALAMGAVAASSVGESMIIDGRSLYEFRYLIGAQALGALAIFAGPMLTLTPALLSLKNRAIRAHGRLASAVGQHFQSRWVGEQKTAGEEALSVPDFSATTDLYSVVANVDRLRVTVLDLRSLVLLVGATLLPYLPLVFLEMPVEHVLQLLLKTVL